jgi:hypothetical protein
MRDNRVWFSLAVLAAACAPVALVGCGDDNGTAPTPPADAAPSLDAGPDSTVAADAGPDSGSDASRDATVSDAVSDQATSETGATTCMLVDAGALDDAAVAAGYSLVANVYQCWHCHQSEPLDAGLTLEGRDASVSDAGLYFPPNLTPDMTGLGCWSDPQIVNAILNGIDNMDASLCIMPKFGHLPMNDAGTEPMDAATAQEIATFLRSLAPVAFNAPMSMVMCPAAAPADGGTGDAGDGGGQTGDAGDGGGNTASEAGPGDAGDGGSPESGPDADSGGDAGDAADGGD